MTFKFLGPLKYLLYLESLKLSIYLIPFWFKIVAVPAPENPSTIYKEYLIEETTLTEIQDYTYENDYYDYIFGSNLTVSQKFLQKCNF